MNLLWGKFFNRYSSGLRITLFFLVFWATNAAHSLELVNIPLSFWAESRYVKTSACMQVGVDRYNREWADFVSEASSARDRALIELISIMKREDKNALYEASHPTRGRSSRQFEFQAPMYFDQMRTWDVKSVESIYEFDDFVVFFMEMDFGKKTGPVVFVFAYDEEGKLGFLPYQTMQFSFQIFKSWLVAKWGPGFTESLSICGESTISNVNYRTPLFQLSDDSKAKATRQASALLLSGSAIEGSTPSSKIEEDIASIMATIKNAASSEDWDSLDGLMEEKGLKELKRWVVAADKSRVDLFREGMARKVPYFYFDASPLVVVYLKEPDKDPETLFFLYNDENKLSWTNFYYPHYTTKVYTDGPVDDLIDEAYPDPPTPTPTRAQ